MINQIDAALLRNMVLSAANNLSANKDAVDALNVFPVPDGDTGTNMGLTFMNAAKEVEANTYASVSDVASAVAKATLRGARGNSGVILSQIFRGISKVLKGLETAGVSELAAALKTGSDTAYSAVMKPTEGTILTVIRKCAQAAQEYEGEDVEAMMEAVIAKGNRTLAKTTQMLPQLQQAGVVDAGGQGLMFVLEGFTMALDGRDVVLNAMPGAKSAHADGAQPENAQQALKTEDIKFTYCTEFIVNKYDPSASADGLRTAIEGKGDCMLIIDEEEIVKVHIHTNNPGYVLEQAVKLGEMVNIKIDNMKHQHSSIINGEKAGEPSPAEEAAPAAPEKELAIISVAAGEGLAQTFRDLNIDGIIEGGQTMNPSTEDILAAANATNAKNVIILPNNKNIILSAEQVQYLTEDRKIFVVPTRSVPEGIAAAMAFSPELGPEELAKAMEEAAKAVKSGSVTFAVRDTSIDGMDIAKGNYLGLSGGKIAAVGEDLNEITAKLIAEMADGDSEVISVYQGSDATEEDAAALEERLCEAYPDADVLFYDGGQPVYYYLISVE